MLPVAIGAIYAVASVVSLIFLLAKLMKKPLDYALLLTISALFIMTGAIIWSIVQSKP